MRKYLAMLCAAMLCACSLALAACGGGAASSSAASAASSSSAASASASSAAADPVEQFVGSWKLAALETEGITMAGDFSQMLGTEAGATLTLEKDGKGSMTFGDDAADVTWTTKDATTIAVTPSGDNAGDMPESIDAVLQDGALRMTMSDEDMTGTLIFTQSGTYEGAKEISLDGAKDITSDSDLAGTWKLSGVSMAGVSMYGDADALAEAVGGETDTTLVFANGTATLMGEEMPYTVSSTGTVLGSDAMSIPVKSLGGQLVVDATGMLGGSMEMAFLFSR